MAQAVDVILIFISIIIMLIYCCTYSHTIWNKTFRLQLSLPFLVIFISLCSLCSVVYTYTYMTPSGPSVLQLQLQNSNSITTADVDVDYVRISSHVRRQKHRRRDRRSHPSSRFQILSNDSRNALRGLINIGSVHSATSTTQTLLCRFDSVICSERNEFSYFDLQSAQFMSIFTRDPDQHLLYDTDEVRRLSNWSMDVDDILRQFPFTDFLSYWDIDAYLAQRVLMTSHSQQRTGDTMTIDVTRFMLYGKCTCHYYHPPTAMIFASMAWHRHWKFFLNIREPIQRMWSVQQHWHHYHGSPSEIRDAAVDDIWQGWHESPMLQQLVHAVSNASVADDVVIALYYRLYFDTLRHRQLEEEKQQGQTSSSSSSSSLNAFAFEMTGSLYCVHVLFWLKQFAHYFASSDDAIGAHLRVVQFEWLTRDLSHTKMLLYCWFYENVDSLEHCSMKTPNTRIKRLYDQNVAAATGHKWTINMAWSARREFMRVFEPCNERLNGVMRAKPFLVLGEWIDYNELYATEKEQAHNDSIIAVQQTNSKTRSMSRRFGSRSRPIRGRSGPTSGL